MAIPDPLTGEVFILVGAGRCRQLPRRPNQPLVAPPRAASTPCGRRTCASGALAAVTRVPGLPPNHPPAQVPDTQLYEIEPFVASMRATPKSGMHNPFKSPERCGGLRGPAGACACPRACLEHNAGVGAACRGGPAALGALHPCTALLVIQAAPLAACARRRCTGT